MSSESIYYPCKLYCLQMECRVVRVPRLPLTPKGVLLFIYLFIQMACSTSRIRNTIESGHHSIHKQAVQKMHWSRRMSQRRRLGILTSLGFWPCLGLWLSHCKNQVWRFQHVIYHHSSHLTKICMPPIGSLFCVCVVIKTIVSHLLTRGISTSSRSWCS